MKYLKRILFLMGFMLMCFNVQSNPLDKFVYSLNEQSVAADWVQDNAQVNLSDSQAKLIVKYVYTHSINTGLNPTLILAMIKTESGFKANAKSNHGAVGLMQVIPYWHKDKLKGRDPKNPSVSIEVGTQVLKDCFDKFNNSSLKGLSCYSGGGGKQYWKIVNKNQVSINNHLKERNTHKSYQIAQK